MRSFVAMFGCSAGFGAVVAIAYFFIAHEEGAGTALLGFMAAALSFATLYAVAAERDANLEGDNPDQTNAQSAGEDLGVFTTETSYPILIAFATLAILTGALWSPLLAVAGFIGMLLCLWRLGAESARA